MRMTLVCAVTVAACGSSTAQTAAPTVQLYGIVDAGVNVVSGLRGGTDIQLASGIMEGSRWGLRGSEDIGGGYRAVFTFESRFESNDGALGNRPPSGSQVADRFASATLLGLPTVLQPAVDAVAQQLGSTIGVNLRGGTFDRQSFVGLLTPVGAFLAGRQYTPAYEVAEAFDTMGTQSSLSLGHVVALPSGIDVRVDDGLAYRVQRGPFSAALMYGMGAVRGHGDANRLLGINALYKVDAYSLGIGYNTRNNELGDKSVTTTLVGAAARVGPGTANILFGTVEDDNPSGLSGVGEQLVGRGLSPGAAFLVQNAYISALRQDANVMNMGYRLVIGVTTIYLAYNRYDDQNPADADIVTYGAAFSHALSKRTDLNLVIARYDNRNLAQAAPGGQGFVGGVTASAGTDANNLALGVRHRF